MLQQLHRADHMPEDLIIVLRLKILISRGRGTSREDMAKTVVIIHGAYGSPEENWFPWLRTRLEEMNVKAIVPRFPTPEHQLLSSWLRILDQEVGEYDEDTIAVGHSLGPALILRKLEELKRPICAAYLVSGFLGRIGQPAFDDLNANFFVEPFDWKVIRSNSKKFYVYNSDNDPYVPLSKGQELASNLGVELRIVHGGGHINKAAGYTEFPRLLEDIKASL